MHRWLELELWLNEIGTPYTDAQALPGGHRLHPATRYS